MDASNNDPGLDARRSRIARMLAPKSVAIIGMSTREGTAGHMVLRNLMANDFAGDIHLVGRSAGEIEGLSIGTDLNALPKGIDAVVLTLPASGVAEALEACAAREVGTAIVFASGFAEAGDEARAEQERIGMLVRDAGISVVGPNCIGYSNYLAGFTVGFTNVAKIKRVPAETRDAVAIVAQSGGLAGHLRLGLEGRGVPVSYNISTGNEMDLCLADFVDHLVGDPSTRVVLLYVEHIREPGRFLAAAARAQAAGKPIVLLHPGRSARAQEAAKSHTGSLAGDYAVMRCHVENAGVTMVDSLDELLDTAEILSRFPATGTGQLGIMTFSGAFCGIAHDFCADAGITIPQLTEATVEELKPKMPPFIEPHNPLDLGTQPIWQPELVGIGLKALLSDPGIGGVAISIPAGSPQKGLAWVGQIVETVRELGSKPVGLALLGDNTPLPVEVTKLALDNRLILTRSSDRLLRAMGHAVRRRPATQAQRAALGFSGLPSLRSGTLPEWQGKAYLAAAGIKTPRGGLVATKDEAAKQAVDIGYPVVLKAQAGALAHKTEAGGVILNLADDAALRAGWDKLIANLQRAQPGLKLDGVLVEAMVGRGTELVVGAKRDPQWGPVLLVGLGGILVEALQDVRLLPASASKAEIVAAFEGLKAAKLLKGFRGMPAADVEAAAEIAWRVGQLMLHEPRIQEIDVNPVMVHAVGEGATALDALIVVA